MIQAIKLKTSVLAASIWWLGSFDGFFFFFFRPVWRGDEELKTGLDDIAVAVDSPYLSVPFFPYKDIFNKSIWLDYFRFLIIRPSCFNLISGFCWPASYQDCNVLMLHHAFLILSAMMPRDTVGIRILQVESEFRYAWSRYIAYLKYMRIT